MQSLPNSAIQNNDSESQDNKNIEIAQSESCLAFEGIDFFGYERNSIFYQFFSLNDNIIKLHYWRQSYYILQYLIPILQLFALSFYPFLKAKWDSQPGEKGYSCCKFIHGFASIYTFSPPNKIAEFDLASFIAIAAITGLIIIITIFCFIYYLFNSHSLPFFLPLLSFILQNLIYVFYFPALSAFTSSFSGLIEQRPLNIFIFAYLLIVLIILTCFIYFSSTLFNFESNPNRSLFASFNGKHVYHVFLFYGIFLILINLTQFLPNWIIYFVIVLKIIFTILLIIEVFAFPFVHFYSNIFAASFYCMSIISDIFVNFKGLSPFVSLFVPLGVFILSFILFIFIFNHIKKRVLKILDILNDAKLSEFERSSILDRDVNPKTLLGAYQFLRLGFVFKSAQILKGKVSIYIAEKMNNVDFWISLTSIISYFPYERENFSLCVKNIKNLFPKGFIEKQRILHLMMLQQHRYLTGTNEIPQRLATLDLTTSNSIALVKKFWEDVSKGDLKNPIQMLDNISNEIKETNDLWLINLRLFPNEYRFAAEYSLFLIEGIGKFEDGIIWLLRASHLERGFHPADDELFRVFVCSLPYFYQDKVVNKHGLLMVEEKFGETETIPDKTQQDKLEEDIEKGMIEQLMFEKFTWPTLRNYLSRATSHYKPKYLSFFKILKILAFLAILILLIVLNIIYSQEFALFQYTYDIVESFNNIRVGLGFLYSSFLLQWANYENFYISSTPYNLTNPAINLGNLSDSLIYWIDYMEFNYINLFYLISQDATAGEKISSLSSKITEESIQRYFCFNDINGNFISKKFNTSMKSTIISSLLTLQSFTHTNYSILHETPQFCEFNLLYPELPDSFTNVSYNLSSLAYHLNNESQEKILIVLIVFISVAFIVWIPLLIIPQMILNFETKRIVSALKSVDSNAAISASQQLTKIVDDEPPLNFVFQHHQNSYSSNIWLWIFLYVLMILIIFIFVITSFVVLHLSFDRFEKFILLDHYGSSRHGLCSEIFSLSIYKMMALETGLEYYNDSHVINLFLSYIDQIVSCSNMFIHGSNNDGISKFSSKIEKLHIEDKCDANNGDLNYYDCMSFQRAISSFIVLSKGMMIDGFEGSLSSTKFNELFHVLTNNIDKMNSESRYLMKEIIKSNKKKALTVSAVLLSIAVIFDIILFIYDIIFINKLTNRMNTALLLIRHLPPPAVVESKAILDILLVETEDHKDQTQTSINDVIFNSITSPVLIIGEGNIIEKVNNSFLSSFEFQSDKIVGHNLDFFIPRIENDESSNELYEMITKIQEGELNDDSFNLVTKCISNKQDEKHNDLMITVNVTVFPVVDDNVINGFVIFVDDKSRTANVENQLNEAKKDVDNLINQLIPSSFINALKNEGNAFSYVIPNSIVVVVHVNKIDSLLELNWEDYNNLILEAENDAKLNPPFFFLQTVFDVFSFIGGLVTSMEMTELASISLEFARSLLKTLNDRIPLKNSNDEKRFSVSIDAGGPLVAGFFNSVDTSSSAEINRNKSKKNVNLNTNNYSFHSVANIDGNNGDDDFNILELENIPIFGVLGKLLIEATKMAVNIDSDDIVVSEDVKNLLQNEKSISFDEGPLIDEKKTYLISSNIISNNDDNDTNDDNNSNNDNDTNNDNNSNNND